MGNFLILNGKLIDTNDAKISPLDSGFTYGFSVYETFLIKNSKIPFFSEHLERMLKSIEFLQIPIEKNFSDIILSDTKKLINSNQLIYARMRLTISPGTWIHPNFNSEKITTIITTTPISQTNKPIKMLTSSYKKTNKNFLPSFVKVTGNFPSILSYKEAISKGFDEAIILRQDNVVTEGSFCNLFWMDKNETIHTPSLNSCILDGVTRTQIILSARTVGINILEDEYPFDHLMKCSSLYISSSTRGLLQAGQLDDRIFPVYNSPIVKEIQDEYLNREEKSMELF